MSIIKKYLMNAKKPQGLFGRLIISSMNVRHGKVSNWGLDHLNELKPKDVLEIGCGGGKNAKKLMNKFKWCKLVAIDYSKVSVEKTKKYNRAEIKEGRCKVIQGDVSAMPFKDKEFDLVTAIETIYFWPGPIMSFKEVYRVLRQGGIFMIVNEADGIGEREDGWKDKIEGLNIWQKQEIEKYLLESGFKEVKVDHDKINHRLCCMAKK